MKDFLDDYFNSYGFTAVVLAVGGLSAMYLWYEVMNSMTFTGNIAVRIAGHLVIIGAIARASRNAYRNDPEHRAE